MEQDSSRENTNIKLYVGLGQMKFPHPKYADDEGFLCRGMEGASDVTVQQMIEGYNWGIFPWFPYQFNYSMWYCPQKRFVIYPSRVHVSHSMRTLLNKDNHYITINKCFKDVVVNCGTVNNRINEDYAWLGPKMSAIYAKLNQLNVCFSVEAWNKETGELVGGFFAADLKKIIVGESMFSKAPNGSKIALILFCRLLEATRPDVVIDCQMPNDYLSSMGGEFADYDRFYPVDDDTVFEF